MKHLQLKQTQFDDGHAKFYIDGRRATKERFRDVLDSAVRIECLQTVRIKDGYAHFTIALIG